MHSIVHEDNMFKNRSEGSEIQNLIRCFEILPFYLSLVILLILSVHELR